MRSRQSVAVPVSLETPSSSPSKKPCASVPSYLSEVRAMQSAQRADVCPGAASVLPTRTVEDETKFLEAGGMYPAAYTLEGVLTHAQQCTACFGRHDLRCGRCLQLLRGAAPRTAHFAVAADSRQLRLF